MGFWSKIFKKKEKEEKVEEKKDIQTTLKDFEQKPITEPQHEREFLEGKCDICGEVIGESKRKRIGGKLFHKKCFKDKYKEMRAQGKVF